MVVNLAVYDQNLAQQFNVIGLYYRETGVFVFRKDGWMDGKDRTGCDRVKFIISI